MCWIFLRVRVFTSTTPVAAAPRGGELLPIETTGPRVHSALILVLTLVSVALSAGAQIALKIGVSAPELQSSLAAGRIPSFFLQAMQTPWVVIGVLMYALSAVTWLLVLARSDLSFAYPFVSLAFVLTAVYGYVALGEPMGLARIGGVGLIVGGVLLVARS